MEVFEVVAMRGVKKQATVVPGPEGEGYLDGGERFNVVLAFCRNFRSCFALMALWHAA
jgi:hypothetical protein